MPVDVEARVIANTRLSPDYNVIALAAPDIAAATAPGQFVMVKLGRGSAPRRESPPVPRVVLMPARFTVESASTPSCRLELQVSRAQFRWRR